MGSEEKRRGALSTSQAIAIATRFFYRAIFLLTGLLLLGLVVSWSVAGKLIAPNQRTIGDPPPDLPTVEIALHSESGSTISGWHIRARPSKGVIILLHALGGSRLSMLSRARLLFEAGYSVIVPDFQAHGESPGDMFTLGHLERHDVRAAVDYALSQHAGEKAAVLGVSFGGAAAVLASPLEVDAMILEAVYPDLERAIHNRTAIRLGPLGWLPAEVLLAQIEPRVGATPETLRPIDRMDELNCAVLVIAGTDDLRTTIDDTRLLYAAARQPKLLWLLEGVAHVDLFQAAPREYAYRVLEFLALHLAEPAADRR